MKVGPLKITNPFNTVDEYPFPILITLGDAKLPPFVPIYKLFPPSEFEKLRLLQFKFVAVTFPLKIVSLLKIFAVV